MSHHIPHGGERPCFGDGSRIIGDVRKIFCDVERNLSNWKLTLIQKTVRFDIIKIYKL